ncbi:TMEM175 family protein [Methanobacterium alcaliphilum]|uniref:TMEM175 family protein n=1 Tax=Methanobacterium alcaliphilum TaxID=392018 RepID=UPI00200A6128|nr:TMEM175 family protein [Methanobacterium alcaliphilum]MCK9152355.1 TMEM175 family protein [Methanobacterium alcaliphilum]
MKTTQKQRLMTTNRIETLVDGIFAIAMTLLVLTLEVPDFPSPVTNATLQAYLLSISSKFFIYALSFILLAVFWRIHHVQFHNIKKSDSKLIWINVIWVMFVALVPFSTSLVGDYGSLEVAAVFFNINMFFIGILSFFNWYYAVHHGLMDNMVIKEYKRHLRLYLLLPVVAIIAILMSFIIPAWSQLSFILISPFKIINDKL